MTLRCPVRLDLAGGWSDCTQWPGPAAVINASALLAPDRYPLELGPDGWRSDISGIGTGLGISSIRYAAEFLAANPGGDYTAHVLQRERDAGTLGGWQDALGALEPGLKLLSSVDHSAVTVTPLDASAVWPHLLLFDTGKRRDSADIGGRVRRAMQDSPAFRSALRQNVEKAHWLASGPHDGPTWAAACIAAFLRLDRIVPMQVGFPVPRAVWGWKPTGAGGGGYGLAFLRCPDDADAVISECREAGVWAGRPVLAEGLKREDSICERVLGDAASRPRPTPPVGQTAGRPPHRVRGRGRNGAGLQARAGAAGH